MLRNLQHWSALHEAHEVGDTLVAADRQSYCLWDIQVFYERRTVLPERQRSALELCLFENYTEADAATKMGIARTNPVAMYAPVGLARLLSLAMAGEMPGYRIEPPPRSQQEGSAA
jgi:hypothetical protein